MLKIPRAESVTGILAAIALWNMPLGILLAALLPSHEVGMLHLTYIGGFGLLILTIAAQVISSHGGVHRFWQTCKYGAIFIASMIGISALVRMSASCFPKYYFFLIGNAALIFITALVLWGIGVLRYLGSKSDSPYKGTVSSKQI